MEPTLTWLDLTAGDRDKMRRVLDLFNEQGTVDEMGLGSLRDALSDALFPGTSSIQTRLRYALFVPWIYRRLEDKRVTSSRIAAEARAAEVALIGALLDQGETVGVIGARARGSLSRLPSSVYWAGLVRWGVFRPAQSQGWYHTHFASLAYGREGVGRADDPGVVWSKAPTWHPRLPLAPDSFPDEATFDLTREEAEFLRGRLEERCAGTLLGWLAQEGSAAPAGSLWDDPDVRRAGPGIQPLVELARRFSLVAEGAPLLYNLLLAERRASEAAGDPERAEMYRAEISRWGTEEDAEAPFDPRTIWAFTATHGSRVPRGQHRFVEAWTRRVREVGAARVADDSALRALVEAREIELKPGRARLINEGRRIAWSGSVGVGRMDFRWWRVRQLLTDLHLGLAS